MTLNAPRSFSYAMVVSTVVLSSCGQEPDPVGGPQDSDEPEVESVRGPGCDVGLDTDDDGYCDRERADWSRDASVEPGTHRADIYQLGDAHKVAATRGIRHTMVWPIDVSGLLLPWQPMLSIFDPETDDAAVLRLQDVAREQLGFGTTDEMYTWLGLARIDADGEAWGGVEWPSESEPGEYLGAGLIDTKWGEALTFSCATCHTAQFFGHTVVGLTNREAQANEFFHSATTFFPAIEPRFFRNLTGATEDELELFVRTQQNLESIGVVLPQARGLDTSLAQVGLSLSRRALDAYASRDPELEKRPRPNGLEAHIADSKPAVWWTLRYKTRWLADGSIVSGNPIFTNFLWNELGRGTDLLELEQWLDDNRDVVDELTVAAFASVAPRWEDIFPNQPIDLASAQRGEVLFNDVCSSCHGTYAKGWSDASVDASNVSELTRTTQVTYFERTPVMDVGTSPMRAQGMQYFADRLNELAISKHMETVVEVQAGYVPPPLDGVFARYPYLHNQSVPTLCDLLSPASERSAVFFIGPDVDPETDFDFDCVGLPIGDAIPSSWKDEPRREYDTTRPGLSNQGHDEWLLDESGQPRFDELERADLIEFLKTL